MDRERYCDDPDDEEHPDPTRRPRKNNRIYCLVWTENDLFKVGLGSGKNTRDASALRSITKHFADLGVTPGRPDGWRADLRALDGRAWGDGQRFEMVFATALKERLKAGAAIKVGFEWFYCRDLHLVQWEEELKAATVTALHFSGLEQPTVEWVKQLSPLASEPHGGAGGSSQRNAWRTTRNKRGECAMKGCGALVTDQDVRQEGFLYCSDAHATADRGQRATDANVEGDLPKLLPPVKETDAAVKDYLETVHIFDEKTDDFWKPAVLPPDADPSEPEPEPDDAEA